MTIPRNTTTEYPTRYRAWDAERVLWLNTDPVKSGPERAVYTETLKNERWPNLYAGVYVEARHTFDAKGNVTGWYIDAQATLPNDSRDQKRWTESLPRHRSATEVLDAVEKLIIEAHQFVGTEPPDRPACTVSVDARCPYYRTDRIHRNDVERVECPTCAGILST